jgi:hypothetical protein
LPNVDGAGSYDGSIAFLQEFSPSSRPGVVTFDNVLSGPAVNDGALSRKEVDERFDLLVADVREYAVFVIAPDGTDKCWNPCAERGYLATNPMKL